MKIIRFLKATNSGYNKGEIAGFDDKYAKKLVEHNVAEYVTKAEIDKINKEKEK